MTPGDAGARLRAETARAVHAVRAGGRSLDDALAAAEARVAAADRPLLRHLCYETLRHHFRLRAAIGALLSRPLKRRDSLIEDLLAVGLAQLAYARVQDHAAVMLTVEAAKLLGRPALAGLVNAILRRYRREPPAVRGDEAEYEHPRWMLARLRQDWPDDWQRIVAANNERAPMWLRVNLRKIDRAEYLAQLAATAPDAAAADTLAGFDAALRLQAPRGVDALPGFDRGLVSVQDAAAQLAAPWLLADGGRRILDACAAPGGKTAHLWELAAPGTSLTAIDSDPARLERVTQTLARVGGEAQILHADAAAPQAWWDGERFDRILVDAPCSASGVIRRHPDIRLLRREADIAALAARQAAMLDALWPLLEPAGRLLYVTCSVFAAENDAVTGAFLERRHDAFEETLLPDNNIRDLMCRKACGWQLLPGTRGLDGFYFACLGKTSMGA